ncbi:hypothetical protein PAUR_b0278 [Pseudoalteromonas aurantia 208]|uniref:Uncharacterized protein n=1 Tax=Pseudoalteromonas aurantia 208 TaxID=1314867 RepID=A0ABR9EHH5_9GAMM|nr:hypothetical protein [Pseudoalteromonas aurantia 208]
MNFKNGHNEPPDKNRRSEVVNMRDVATLSRTYLIGIELRPLTL